MLMDRLQRGVVGERVAARFLTAQGFTIHETRARFPVGEIDIVAWEGPCLCFVEVRSRSSLEWGGPLDTLTDQKRRRLIRAARWYLQRLRSLPSETRFDVVAIQWHRGARPAVALIRDAFSATRSDNTRDW